MTEILSQAAKAAKASQSQPKQAKASKRKQKQAIEPARAWVQNEFHCNKEHQPKSCEDLPKTPQQPRTIHKGPESPRMLAHSSQTFPKSFQISQNRPKIHQNRTKIQARRPQEHFWRPLQIQAWKRESPKQPKKPQEAPNPSQTLPWTFPNRPKTSPNQIFEGFFGLVFPIANLHRFFVVFLQNLRVFSKADLQISCAHAMFRGPPHRLTLFEKITRNHRKIFPKSFPNLSQNLEKSIQNRKKSLQKRKII